MHIYRQPITGRELIKCSWSLFWPCDQIMFSVHTHCARTLQRCFSHELKIKSVTFKRGVHMWLFVSQCGHCSCGLWCLNCILLLFFRPWGRLCNCITYKLLCSVVTGCTCKCTVSEFPKTTNFFLAVYHTFLCWPFWRIF